MPLPELGGFERILITFSPLGMIQSTLDSELPCSWVWCPPHFRCQDNYSAYLHNPLHLTQDFHTCYISSYGVNIIFHISQMRSWCMVVRKCTCTRSKGGMSSNPGSAKNGLSHLLPSLGLRQLYHKLQGRVRSWFPTVCATERCPMGGYWVFGKRVLWSNKFGKHWLKLNRSLLLI